MLDLNLIRKDPDLVQEALKKKLCEVDFGEFLEWDKKQCALRREAEELKAEKNKASAAISRLKDEGEDFELVLAEQKTISVRIKDLDTQITELEVKISDFLDSLPNLPDKDLLPGGKKNNKVIRKWGKKPEFPFRAKDHLELAKDLGLIDYERGVKLGGNGFWAYRQEGALLEWALLNYFIEEHLKDGYEFILPPHILTYQCGYTAGQFPKFTDDVFTIEENKGRGFGQFMLPTAETALVNLHRDEILREEDLPKKYFAYTPCYRKEAGGYRAEEKGMIRGHQFNKVEMVQYTRPEDSDTAFNELVHKAEKLVQGLGLHYRVSKLAAADCAFAMAKTYDIEVWLPSMNTYKEVSSVSNAKDFQARRGKMRFRRSTTKKPEFVHTLNGSGLATSRLFPAILEQFQQEDGSVLVPLVLRKWLKKEILTK